jgi:hypothetical protein
VALPAEFFYKMSKVHSLFILIVEGSILSKRSKKYFYTITRTSREGYTDKGSGFTVCG